MKRLFFFFLFITSSIVHSLGQDINFAKNLIDTLASPSFDGRGYVNKGDVRAAHYIANIFDSLGLQPVFQKGYLQNFAVSVNTLPGEIKVVLGEKELNPGIDYLVDPASPTTSGTFPLLVLSQKDFVEPNKLIRKLNQKDVFAVIPATIARSSPVRNFINYLKYDRNSPVAGVVEITDQKLTWFGASWQYEKPALIVSAEAFPLNAEEISLNIDATYVENYKAYNVLGKIEGASDSIVMITAHYDHLGRMGQDTYFPGANDNASGTAMIMDLARHYVQSEKPKYTLIFTAFGAEEIGLLGSNYLADNSPFPLSKIKFLLNFDLAGTGDDGIQVVNGAVYEREFNLLRQINESQKLLPQVKVRGEACNSDHCPFYKKGVPGFFIYTLGGIKAYHDIDDKASTLPLTEYEDYFKLINSFLEDL